MRLIGSHHHHVEHQLRASVIIVFSSAALPPLNNEVPLASWTRYYPLIDVYCNFSLDIDIFYWLLACTPGGFCSAPATTFHHSSCTRACRQMLRQYIDLQISSGRRSQSQDFRFFMLSGRPNDGNRTYLYRCTFLPLNDSLEPWRGSQHEVHLHALSIPP